LTALEQDMASRQALLPEYEQTLAALRAQYRQLQEQLADRQRLLEMELRIQGLEASAPSCSPVSLAPCAARNTTRWLSVTMRQMLAARQGVRKSGPYGSSAG
jgi:exonuclease SbcC